METGTDKWYGAERTQPSDDVLPKQVAVTTTGVWFLAGDTAVTAALGKPPTHTAKPKTFEPTPRTVTPSFERPKAGFRSTNSAARRSTIGRGRRGRQCEQTLGKSAFFVRLLFHDLIDAHPERVEIDESDFSTGSPEPSHTSRRLLAERSPAGRNSPRVASKNGYSSVTPATAPSPLPSKARSVHGTSRPIEVGSARVCSNQWTISFKRGLSPHHAMS